VSQLLLTVFILKVATILPQLASERGKFFWLTVLRWAVSMMPFFAPLIPREKQACTQHPQHSFHYFSRSLTKSSYVAAGAINQHVSFHLMGEWVKQSGQGEKIGTDSYPIIKFRPQASTAGV
jgi:hypothetical protein